MSAGPAVPQDGQQPSPSDGESGWTGGHNPWVIAMVVTLATFMEILDTSIANVALPQISGNLGVARNEGTWVITSYLVANAVVIPLSGWLSNRLGRKRFYMTCVAVFSIASLLCGLAPTLSSLVVFRVLQGLGGGGLVPMEQAILVDTFPPSQRSMAMALYGMTTVLAPALGPTLGGVITDHFSWRWIFLINIPIGLLSLVLTARVLSDPPHAGAARDRSRPVDWPGLAFVAVGLGLLEFVLERGHELDWFASPMITKCSLIAGVALVCFVVREWTHDDPVVDLRLLRNRNFAVANLLMMALAFTSFGVTVLMPQYLWALMGYSATDAGLVLSPGGLLIFCLLPIAGRIAPKVDARVLVSFGFLLVGASIFYTARQINTEMDYGAAVRLRMLQCAGFAFLFIPIQMLAYSRIPSHKNNQAASLMNLSRNLGASLGIAFLVGLISHYRQVHQVQLVAHATEYDAGYKAALAQLSDLFQRSGTSPFESSRRALAVVYDEILKQSMQLAYVDALMGLAAVSSVAVVVVWFARLRAPAS